MIGGLVQRDVRRIHDKRIKIIVKLYAIYIVFLDDFYNPFTI